MCVALIGGMERLRRQYMDEAGKHGVRLRVYNRQGKHMSSSVRNVDAVVIFTGKVSHRARNEAHDMARSMNLSVLMSHSCGICSLRSCLRCLNEGSK